MSVVAFGDGMGSEKLCLDTREMPYSHGHGDDIPMHGLREIKPWYRRNALLSWSWRLIFRPVLQDHHH